MKLEAVVTCSGYADFLAHTLPHNRILFDRLVVVCPHDDKDTQRVCEYWHVQCVPSARFEAHLGKFRKGAGINDGLAKLDKTGWVMQMDADIVLPPLTRRVLEGLSLDETCIYGMDRFMCPSFREWTEFISNPKLLNENETWVHLSSFPLGVRVTKGNMYIPIGFVQLWHPATSGIPTYPEEHASAARGDMAFAEQWPRNKRGFLPELVAYHLESEKADMGANWNGRATKKFGPFEEGYKD